MVEEGPLQSIRDAFRSRRFRFTVHGAKEATADDFSVDEIRDAIMSESAEIVEDYPNEPRGPCCLILGWTRAGRPLHAVISYPLNVAIITVYEPTSDRWLDPRTRR